MTITLLYLTKPLVSIVIVKSDKTPISDILAYHSTNRGEANWVFFLNRLSKPLCNSRLTFKSFALLQTLSNSVKQSNCESRNSVVSFHANVADGGWHIEPWIYDIFFHLSILVKQERDKKKDLRKFFSWSTKNHQLVTIEMFSWERVSEFNCCNLKTKIKPCFGGFTPAHCVIVTCVWRHANSVCLYQATLEAGFAWFWKKKVLFLSCVIRKYELRRFNTFDVMESCIVKWAKTFESI